MYSKPFHQADLNKLSFLVTGGAGFIGSNIVEYLVKYNTGKIRILDNLATGSIQNIEPFLNLPNVEFIQGDITDEKTCTEACQNIDYVLHQAALGSVPRSIKDPIATNNVNSTGFLNILVAAKEANVKRVVYASSSSVYGDSPKLPKVEAEIGKPLSPYAVSKLTNELYADVFHKVYGMEIIGLRYFNIFGPKQSPQGEYAAAIPLFINAVLNQQSPYINGDGEQTRDFTFVENAVQANIRSALSDNKEAINQVFNVAVGENTSINNLFQLLNEFARTNVKSVHRADRPGDVRNSLADISKATRLIGYVPTAKLKEGLKITLEWFERVYSLTKIE